MTSTLFHRIDKKIFKLLNELKDGVINKVCANFFQFLTITIINGHLWDDPLDYTVKLQKLEITEKISTTRLMLLDTFYFILKCNC